MKVLVIGKGGREHALVWKFAQSPRVERVYCAPGNAGTAQDGVNVPIEATDFDGLVRFVRKENIGLTVVGPEDPLARGIVDIFRKPACASSARPRRPSSRQQGIRQEADAARRRADGGVSRLRPSRHARHYIETREYPVVVKADGLAAGKGVIVCPPTKKRWQRSTAS